MPAEGTVTREVGAGPYCYQSQGRRYFSGEGYRWDDYLF